MATAAPSRPVAPARMSTPYRLIFGSLLAGILLTIFWSFEFVDSTIGDNVANSVLGYDAKATELAGPLMGVVFAFVSGLAGTFTACNIACFGAVAPLLGQSQQVSKRVEMMTALKAVGWLTLGMVVVSGLYGAIGALIGPGLPQLSTETTAAGMPIRLVQSSLVFGVVGLAFLYLGAAAVGVLPDAFQRLRAKHPRTDVVVMGVLIGAFLIGRPFPLFFKLFNYAASTHDAFLGAGAFVLQSLGNIVVMVGLFFALFFLGGGRFRRWLQASPGRINRFTAGALIFAGSFTFFYWMLRVPAIFGYGWFPTFNWG